MALLRNKSYSLNYVNKRIHEIKCSNEMLSYGLSELEAVYVRIQADMVPHNEMGESRQNAVILNSKNHCLAHAINKALKEVESSLRLQMEAGLHIEKEVVHEFSVVLRESIRILHEYRIIHAAYQDHINRMKSTSISFSTHSKKCHRRRQRDGCPAVLRKFQRVIRILCICGGGSTC